MKRNLTHADISLAASNLAGKIKTDFGAGTAGFSPALYGIPRGGVAAALALARHLPGAYLVDSVREADIIIDDLVDSGATMAKQGMLNPQARQAVLFAKDHVPPGVLYGVKTNNTDWMVFPWEGNEAASAEDIGIRLLQYVGEDSTRGGLLETPHRFLKAWRHWTKGYNEKPEDILKVFEDGAEGYNEMVIVKDIPIYSKCEHHLADIFGTATIAYIPNKKIVGLSKLSRLADIFARRLQVQERLTTQIADSINQHLEPKGVAVLIKARHMCMESRGICQQGHCTITSALRGVFENSPAARAEFMQIANA